MTANSPSSVAESTSNTVDPDAQERRANDDELSAGFLADLAVNERVWGMAAAGSVRPGPMPADTEARSGRFAELIAKCCGVSFPAIEPRRVVTNG